MDPKELDPLSVEILAIADSLPQELAAIFGTHYRQLVALCESMQELADAATLGAELWFRNGYDDLAKAWHQAAAAIASTIETPEFVTLQIASD